MPFLIKALVVSTFFLLTAGRNFTRLWKGGLIGVGIMLVADTAGHFLNLYHYQNELIMIGGVIPAVHVFNMFLFSMLYLNWLPQSRAKIILYTVYTSVLFLSIESVMYRAGAIVYLNWELWYSYFLIFFGLLLLAYLSDFMRHNAEAS